MIVGSTAVHPPPPGVAARGEDRVDVAREVDLFVGGRRQLGTGSKDSRQKD